LHITPRELAGMPVSEVEEALAWVDAHDYLLMDPDRR
jgi:hypothetical protein